MEHPEHRPGNSANNHEFVLGEPISALDVQNAKNPYEENPEDEEKDGREIRKKPETQTRRKN